MNINTSSENASRINVYFVLWHCQNFKHFVLFCSLTFANSFIFQRIFYTFTFFFNLVYPGNNTFLNIFFCKMVTKFRTIDLLLKCFSEQRLFQNKMLNLLNILGLVNLTFNDFFCLLKFL